MMKTASKYAPNKIASAKKHIFSRLLDYFLTFVGSLTLFALLFPLSTNIPLHKGIVKDLGLGRKELYQYIDSTGILHYNEDETDLLSINEEADKYLMNLTKTSAYVHNIGFPVRQDDGTYIDEPVELEDTFIYDRDNYPLDNMSYYYRVFKRSYDELNNYNGKRYDELTTDELDEYQYVYVMKLNDEAYVSRGGGVSRYVVLNEENTTQLLRFYKNDRNDTKLYNSIYGCYGKGLQKAIKEIENKSLAYKTIENKINDASRRFSAFEIVVYLLCYTLAYVLINLILSLVNKEWTTAGLKTMKLAMTDTDEMEPQVWQYLIYHLLCFLAFVSSSLLSFLLVGSFGITSLNIVPHISYLMVMLFILPFNLVSLFMPLFNKKYHHDLSTFLTRIVYKDKYEFDVPVGADISDKVENGQQ